MVLSYHVRRGVDALRRCGYLSRGSASAIGKGIGAASATAAAYRAGKRVARTVKKVFKSKRVVRKTARRVRHKDYARNPSGSTFVKCTDVKLKDVKRYITPFQRKVMMATMPEYSLRVFNSEFTFICKAGPVNNTSNISQIVGWNQIGINTLNPHGLYADSTGAGQGARLLCSSFHADYVSTPDPFGLYRQGWSSATTINSNVNYTPPSLFTSISNMVAVSDGTFWLPQYSHRIWQGDTYVTLELRNPQQFGVRANIYEVGARAKQEIFHANLTSATHSAYNLGNFGSPSFSNASFSVDYAKSPLETFIYGMARKGVNQSALANSRSIGLNDSPDFVDNFRTYKVCSVYVPPGGTLYKSYKIGSRFLDSTHLIRNTYDKSTKFLVIKTIPEIQLLPGKTAGAIDGSIVGVNSMPGDAASGNWYNSVHADPHLICSLTQRTSARMIPASAGYKVDFYQQYGWIPSGQPYVNGSSVKQNNDIGSKTLTGANDTT